MGNKTKYTLSFILTKPKRVFSLAAETQIAELLSGYGYNELNRQDDLEACANAEAKVQAQERAAGEAQTATLALKQADELARSSFKSFRTVCTRLALKGDDIALRTLGIQISPPLKRDLFLILARSAYQNARTTPDILTRTAVYGYNDQKLQDGIAELDAIVQAQQTRESTFGIQQMATVAQHQALLDVEERYRKFLVLVDLALKEPQLREKLGLVEG